MKPGPLWGAARTWIGIGLLAAMSLVAGCHGNAMERRPEAGSAGQQTFILAGATGQRAMQCLSRLNLGTARPLPDRDALALTGSPDQLAKARVVLELIDGPDEFVVEALVPASKARLIPSNDQIARALGDISIGTFAEPPLRTAAARGIIDIHEDAVVAIIPSRFRQDLYALGGLGPEGIQQRIAANNPAQTTAQNPEDQPAPSPAVKENSVNPQAEPNNTAAVSSTAVETSAPVQPRHETSQSARVDANQPALAQSSAMPGTVAEPAASEPAVISDVGQREVTITTVVDAGTATPSTEGYSLSPLPNGDETLELDLPQTIDLVHLLDLAAEYLNLDYMYEPSQIAGQTITLKLSGKLEGRIRIKDLYPLLESVLKFKGLAMTRHQGKLVTIVPLENALEIDPRLMGPEARTVEAGDMVVTRVLQLRHIDASSAMSLLEDMKLSVAISPIEETQSLIVTCYAHRMSRIEQLLSMIDKPGRPRRFQFRQLKYTMADVLVGRLQVLAEQLQSIPVTIAPSQRPSSRSGVGADLGAPIPAPVATRSGGSPKSSREPAGSDRRPAVYIDADERTNRVLILGFDDEIAIVEKLIDALDVARQELRSLHVYCVNNVSAKEARDKLEGLEIIGKPAISPRTSPLSPTPGATSAAGGGWSFTVEGGAVEEPQVVVLEATNALLVNATKEQHARIEEVMKYVDTAPEDRRTMRVYEIQYLDAKAAKDKLTELGVLKADTRAGSDGEVGRISRAPASPDAAKATPAILVSTEAGPEDVSSQEPQVIVLESTNALLVWAAEGQHVRIAETIKHIDAKTREEAIPYEIYFLENQDPEHLAEVLQKILQETIKDKEGKIQQVIQKTDEQIMIVPDKDTFSLIVYANKKNQEWVSKLIKSLDKRRPQVVIDATLVEIRKNDEFNYDLEVVASIPDLTQTSGQTGQFVAPDNTTVTDRLLDSDRDRFIDFQIKSGKGIGFYADKHIQALLTAVQTKNYGRVLAKPKVLVNDNEKGSIKTADTTYVATRSSIPVTTGAAGQQSQLIETAVKYEAYEAGITLEITPHISEGDLLRLEIMLSRSDFTGSVVDKPPNQTSSDVTTVVTVPDGSTIILGGMLKLNQNKGGSKVPILGDIPLIGGLFRSVDSSDIQSMLYIFVRAEIIRPAEALANSYEGLQRISEQNRQAFEKHENEFQGYQVWPGIKPKPVPPAKTLEAH